MKHLIRFAAFSLLAVLLLSAAGCGAKGTKTTCARCGKEITVDVEDPENWTFYCDDCYAESGLEDEINEIVDGSAGQR